MLLTLLILGVVRLARAQLVTDRPFYVQWTDARNNKDLLSIHFAGPRTGWAVESAGTILATKNGGRTGRYGLAGLCWMAGWKPDLARAVIIRSTICPLRNVKGRNESVRSVVVVQAETKIRLGHPHAPNLIRQRGGERRKDMQERSLAMASLDAVV